MRRGIEILAALLAIVTVSLWFAKGANPGWTKNRIQVKTIDPVTEIEQVEWEDKFVPGLDFLGGGLAGAGALTVGSLFLRKHTKQQNPQNS
jgi:hypothetical protein